MTRQTEQRKKGTAQKPQKVFVGISGGVDSAVSASLLKKAGYDVTGIYIKVWQPDWISCTWKEERRDAMRVAAHLKIPFVTLDLEKEYKHGVIDYMIAEYAAGRTPNPDVMCNREVKFGAFWKWAQAQGADFVATGHYAQVKENGNSWTFSLLVGLDKNKDQSYFLWTLNQKDLEHVLFPIGHLEKPEVRALAKRFGLPNADKKDSQGLCFIGKVDIKEFLQHYLTKETQVSKSGIGQGDVLNIKGEKIGTHPGALFFTLGERHGFTIVQKSTNDSRYYVIAKDMKRNTITVDAAYTGQLDANKKQVIITNVNWSNITPPKGAQVQVRTRYRQPLINARISSTGAKNNSTKPIVTLELTQITDPVTPGQSLVMYLGEECIGGGLIS